MTSQTEIRKATDRTLPYLLDRELEALQSRTIVKTYEWRYRNQLHRVDVEFRVASASYIDVSYDGQPIDCINVWDYQKGVPKVRTRKDYWKDTETVRDMIRGGLGLPMAGSR